MKLQLALDEPAHLAVLPQVQHLIDIVEIGTPLLKTFGTSAIATVRRMAPELPLLADTKTIDAGALEADLVFSAGATMMTVLGVASEETLEAACAQAASRGGVVIVDTIATSHLQDPLEGLPPLPPEATHVGIHRPTDAAAAIEDSVHDVETAHKVRASGRRVSLAGGITRGHWSIVEAAEPDIVVVGRAITAAAEPKEVAQWMRSRMP